MVSEEACYKTYPYSKSSQKDLLIMNIRKASRSNTQNSASTNGNGSSRCNIIGGNCYGNNSGAAGGTSSQYSSPSSPFNRDGIIFVVQFFENVYCGKTLTNFLCFKYF